LNIVLHDIGKKYNYQWIFRNIHMELAAPAHMGILGNNGSGKTTLLKVISGFLTPSEGKITWRIDSNDISESIFKYTGIASPHLELIEEFTLEETLTFHNRFKSFIGGHSPASIIKLSGLGKSSSKPIKYFSSGMKQRVKLLLAVMSNNALIVLDEPCANLDERSVEWYQQLLNEYVGDRLLIIGSNDRERECFSCTRFIQL
jgi:ABC-2 type transport system ATP-binding protein